MKYKNKIYFLVLVMTLLAAVPQVSGGWTTASTTLWVPYEYIISPPTAGSTGYMSVTFEIGFDAHIGGNGKGSFSSTTYGVSGVSNGAATVLFVKTTFTYGENTLFGVVIDRKMDYDFGDIALHDLFIVGTEDQWSSYLDYPTSINGVQTVFDSQYEWDFGSYFQDINLLYTQSDLSISTPVSDGWSFGIEIGVSFGEGIGVEIPVDLSYENTVTRNINQLFDAGDYYRTDEIRSVSGPQRASYTCYNYYGTVYC